MSDEKTGANSFTGVSITGGSVTVGGNVVGRDMNVGTQISPIQIEQIFNPIRQAIRACGGEKQAAADQKLDELKSEAAKWKDAKDSVLAKLIDGLVELVPGAVSAVAGAFGTPLLGGIAGPATKYVLDKIQGK